MKRKIALIFCAVFLAVGLSGCKGYDKVKELILKGRDNIVENTSLQSITVANTITVGMYDYDTFNPLVTKSDTVREAMEFVYEPLFTLDEQMKIVPVLAKDYGMSADGKTIAINLKDNVMWHDGTGFSAYDVQYTIRQIKSGVTTYTKKLDIVSGYSVTGDYQITVSFTRPTPNAASLFTFPIVKNGTNMTQSGYYPIGTGPFAYSGKISTDRYMLNAFDYYYNGKAKLDGVYIDVSPDKEKYFQMFNSGAFDTATSNAVDLGAYTPRGGMNVNEFIGSRLIFLGINNSDERLTGADTRSALSNLTDREYIVSSILYSRAEKTDIPVNPSSWLYSANSTEPDEAYAQSKLEADGWVYTEQSGYERKVNGEKQELSLELLVNSENKDRVSIADKIALDFNKHGIRVKVKSVDYETYTELINAKQYDLFIGEYMQPATQEITELMDSKGNLFDYKNDTFDMLMSQIGMTYGENELKALYTQLAELFRSETPFVPIAYVKECTLTSAQLKNVLTPGIGGFYRQSENWSIK